MFLFFNFVGDLFSLILLIHTAFAPLQDEPFENISALKNCPSVPTTCRNRHWGRVQHKPSSRQRRGPKAFRLPAMPTAWRQVESHISGGERVTFRHSMVSGTKLLERVWNLLFSRVAQDERSWVGVGILASSELSQSCGFVVGFLSQQWSTIVLGTRAPQAKD